METKVLRRNNVNIIGKGQQPMLFVNGYGCDQTIWRFITPAFIHTHKVILYDHVGSGNSDISAYDFEKYNSLDGYASDIIDICKELELKNTIIVGHSVGSIISMLAAIKEPGLFDKVVQVSPSPCYISDGDYIGGFEKKDIDELIEALESNYLGWASSITPVITGNPNKPEIAEELTNRFCRNDPNIAKHFAKVTFLSDNRADLPKVKNRTLIIQVTEDVIAPISVGIYMSEKIPDNKLEFIEGTGHVPNLTHPKETIHAITTFLNS